MKYVYIGGPYSAPEMNYDLIEQHIKQAEEAAIKLSEHGIGFFCPHTHTAHFEVKSKAPESFYRQVDEYFLQFCHALLLLPGWQNSTGSVDERDMAFTLPIPVFVDIEYVIRWAEKDE